MIRTRLLKSVALMMGAAMVSKALYIIREPIIAAYFGRSAETDAYNVAMTIVTMLLSVTVSPIGSVLVPVYVDRLHQSQEEGKRFIHQTLTLYLLILSSVFLVAYFAAPWLAHLYASGFTAETSSLAAHLIRILAFFAVVSGLSGYFNMVLTAHQRFLWVALGPIVTAALVIVILLTTASHLGIDALAWGMVAGNAVQMLLLGLSTWHQAVRLGLDFHLGKAVRTLGKLSGWMLAGRFVGQGNDLIDQHMLSYLGVGSIAALGFARSIYLLPFSIFTTGITRVIFADFSWDAAQGDTEALKRDLSLAVRMAAFFLIPSAVAFIVLGEPLIQVLYQRGAFDQVDTQATVAALIAFALGLFPRTVVFIYARLFLASQRVDWFFLMTLVGLLSHTIINILFIPVIGHTGAALGLSVGDAAMAGMAYLLALRQGVYLTRQAVGSLIKMTIAGLMMGGLLWSLMQLSPWQIQPVYLLVGLGIVGVGAYLAIGILFRLQELVLVRQLAVQYLSRGARDAD